MKVLIVGRLERSMSEVVHSVNIMVAILLVGVCVTIYWIFKYDDWYPNTVDHSNQSQSDDTGSEELGSGTD